MNIKEKLKIAKEVQEFIKERSIQLLEAKGMNKRFEQLLEAKGMNKRFERTLNFSCGEIEFEDDSVYCYFNEITSHDVPEQTSLSLSYDELTLNDEDWNNMIKRLEDETLRREAERIQKEKERINSQEKRTNLSKT